MDTTEYALNERTITLTKEEANELRKMLQLEFIKECINFEIDEVGPDCFHFNSEKSRSRFVNEIANNCNDLIDMLGRYEDELINTLIERAKERGVWVDI